MTTPRLTMAAAETGGDPGSLWLQICEEYEREQPCRPAGFKSGGKSILCSQDAHLDAEEGETQEEISPQLDPRTCSPHKYLENYIFPILLPGMAEMLVEAKKEKCFVRKRTKFIACDFLTQWLYNKNPKRQDQQCKDFFEIPFVQEWLKDHPRPPIPLSLLLSDEEAAILIQSFWRGYRVRCDPEVQQFRQWQKDHREGKDIKTEVHEIWENEEAKVQCGTSLLPLPFIGTWQLAAVF
ncbi:IQ domain-containing protein K [Gastrophryne carolinensis]